MPKRAPHYTYDKAYISLADLDLGTLPRIITVDGHNLRRKSEFHISLICIRDIAALIDEQNKTKVEKEITNEFQKFIQKQPLDNYTILGSFRFIQRDNRKTVVAMVSVPHLNEFFSSLRSKFGKDLPTQATHITLYTLQPDAGIGILSVQELERDSRLIELPKVKILASPAN